MTQKSVTIILPTYQEVESLPRLIPAIEEVRNHSIPQLTLIIVDDDSNDGTQALIKELALPWVTLIIRKENRGLSPAVIRGLDESSSDYCVVMDADGSHPPSAIPSMVEALEQGADFVVGSRYIKGGSTQDGWGVLRWLNSKAATIMAMPFTKVKDPMSGFLGLATSTYHNAEELNPIGYKIGLELIVKCRCKNVVEVPIHFRTRILGESKLTLKVQWEYLQHVIRLLRFTHPKLVSFFTFATVGLSGAVVYMSFLSLISTFTDDNRVAIAMSAWIAMSWNFIWDRKYAFWNSRNKSIVIQYFSFAAICTVPIIANYFITLSQSETRHIVVAGAIGTVLGSAIGIVFNYVMSRLLVFRK